MEQLDYTPEDSENLEENSDIFEMSAFPEAYQDIVGRHNEEFRAILEQTLPAELIDGAISRITFERDDPTEVNRAYGVSAVAVCETGGVIKIFEGFFEKTYAEQQYILAHETGHALTQIIFSGAKTYEELSRLNASSDSAGETLYVQHMAEMVQRGKLDQRALFHEQTAERMAAYILGGGDFANMLEIQAIYLREPGELFRGIPEDILKDKDALRNFLNNNETDNKLLEMTREYHRLINGAVRQTEQTSGEVVDWHFRAVDDSTLGESPFLSAHSKHHEEAPLQTKSLWSFLLEFLLQTKQP
ncbi:MAG: hypothetical protein WEC81_00075 [Patescibacteria group bacterium]